jgi:hypothetical protein
MCASSFVLLAVALPFILPLFLLLSVLFVWLRQTYLASSREVKRWEATTRWAPGRWGAGVALAAAPLASCCPPLAGTSMNHCTPQPLLANPH